jgi:hypothetical protein
VVIKPISKINVQKVYLCGFSNGSFLTQRIAFEKNTQFAATGTIGGTMMKNLYDNDNHVCLRKAEVLICNFYTSAQKLCYNLQTKRDYFLLLTTIDNRQKYYTLRIFYFNCIVAISIKNMKPSILFLEIVYIAQKEKTK